MSDGEYQVVIMTAPNGEEAERIAGALVGDGLAACVNMVESCRSIYRWQGKIEKDSEVVMFVKTRRDRFKEIESRVSELHSYDVPEIIAVDLTDIADGYREFLDDVLGK